MPRGQFIAIEGIDGSGKRTQLDLLARAFEKRGVPYLRVSFPNYESFFGKLVARFLNGEFGGLEQVDPHFSALLYAGDRFESKKALNDALDAGKTILADRYVGSNLAHQTARVVESKRGEFLAWLRRLEYELYGLPQEDLVIYLRLPAKVAHRLIALKRARKYTELQRDILEADIRHLEEAAGIYDQLAKAPNWTTVNCFDASDSVGDPRLLPPENIHREVLAAIDSRLARPTDAGPRAQSRGRS
ncbi:MAG TPA: hypothetical protein VFO34_14835 [Candidatus Acidoferrales bacterium]|nr:hypothetical protein [Candidatus Acidoferrales bacterium]